MRISFDSLVDGSYVSKGDGVRRGSSLTLLEFILSQLEPVYCMHTLVRLCGVTIFCMIGDEAP